MVRSNVWQIQEAKARFSELVRRAGSDGPQIVTLHGAEAAVILSAEEYRWLAASRPGLGDYLLGGPKVDDALADSLAERDPDPGRSVPL